MRNLIMWSTCLLLHFSINTWASDSGSMRSPGVTATSHTTKVQFESSPIGASVYLNGRQLGVCPFVANITLSDEECRDAAKSTGKFIAQWKSGATKEKLIRFDVGKASQVIWFSRPTGGSGWSADIEFAAELEKSLPTHDQINAAVINVGQSVSRQEARSDSGASIEQQRLELERERADAEFKIQQQRLELDRARAESEAKIQQQRLELQEEQAYAESLLQQERLDEERRQARESERQWEAERTTEAVYKLTDQMNRISDQMQRNSEARSNIPIQRYGTGSGYQPYGR